MKLKAAQLKALDDSDFGLPGQRRYPMPDKQHVRSAIQFFKYAKPEERKELAANINKKAKQYGMKINVKGEFSKYASPDIVGIGKEASNVGVLEPIVGGVNTPYEKDIPRPEDDDADYVQKALGLIVRESANNTANTDFVSTICGLPELRAMYQNRLDDEAIRMAPDSHFKAFDDYIRRIIANKEISDNAAYYAMNAYPKGPMTLKERIAYANADSLKKVIDMTDSVNDENEDFMAGQIGGIAANQKSREDALAILGAVYNRSKDCSLVNKVISSMIYDGERLPFGYLASGEVHWQGPLDAAKDVENVGFCKGEIMQANDILSRISPQRIYDKFCDYLQVNRIDSKLPISGEPGYVMMGHILDRYASLGDARRYVYYNTGTTPTMFINGRITKNRVMPAIVFKNKNVIEMAVYDETDDLVHGGIVLETLMDKIKLAPEKLLTAARGISITDQGDILLNLKDKLTFDHYNETHRVVMENINTGNVSAMKENAAYIFSVISTIENRYTFNKSIDRTSKTFLDMQRLRGLFVSDFKLLMRNISKQDKKFDFVKFYAESRYNQSVLRIDKKILNLITTIFIKLMRF